MNILQKEHLVPDLKSTTAFQAIDDLLDHLVSVGTLAREAKDSIASAVKRREQSMSTGIGFGVALPHASTALVKETVMAFGRSTRGIEFEAVDQQPVRLVMLVLFPSRDREKHLPTLARISQLFQRKEIRAALEAAPDVGAIADVFDANPLASA